MEKDVALVRRMEEMKIDCGELSVTLALQPPTPCLHRVSREVLQSKTCSAELSAASGQWADHPVGQMHVHLHKHYRDMSKRKDEQNKGVLWGHIPWATYWKTWKWD